MTDNTASASDARKSFVQALEAHPLTEDVDFTRDGYRTVRLELADPDEDELAECSCGAVGLPERVSEDGHDCEAFQSDE